MIFSKPNSKSQIWEELILSEAILSTPRSRLPEPVEKRVRHRHCRRRSRNNLHHVRRPPKRAKRLNVPHLPFPTSHPNRRTAIPSTILFLTHLTLKILSVDPHHPVLPILPASKIRYVAHLFPSLMVHFISDSLT